MIKVLHLITGLRIGGAETMLFNLVSHLNRNAFEPEVLSLTDIGATGKRIQALHIPVGALGMRLGVPDPLGLARLTQRLRSRPPDVLQTWMYHADLIGAVGARLAGGIPTVWNIRHSNLSPKANKRAHLWTARVCAKISRWLPARIVINSETSRLNHEKLGYAPAKMQVIPNGFDPAMFKVDPIARVSVRQELGLPEPTLLIGLVARFDRQKDHHNFIQAAARLVRHCPEVHFLLCGRDVTSENEKLRDWIRDAGIEHLCHLLGSRDDVPRLTAALDIATSSSLGEGFCNAIGEAMACGVPCVVTDVGDSAWLVGDTGRVVPPMNPAALADAWRDLIGDSGARRELGLAARRRVQDYFNLPVIVRQYERLYEEIAECADSLGCLTH